MKNTILIFLLIIFSFKSTAQNLVTSEVIQKVFCIKYGDATASCFLVSINKHDYLITAKHLFPNVVSKTNLDVELLNNKGWNKINCKLLTHSNTGIDIAVLDLMTSAQPDNEFDLNEVGYSISQECFFLGYPFGLRMDDKAGNMNSGFPLPFVKKAIISSWVYNAATGTQIFLDGHNNPGFSGGPVAIINNKSDSGSSHRMKIIGVISGYLPDNKIIKTALGEIVNPENSGIVVCYGIAEVYEIIKMN
jgi:hypothetical protein